MLEGFWTAEFGTNTGTFGGGVAVFREGRILGGDATYYYVGEYKQEGNRLVATLRLSPFITGAPSVFGTVSQDLILELEGTVTTERTPIAQGHRGGTPSPHFAVKLTKRG